MGGVNSCRYFTTFLNRQATYNYAVALLILLWGANSNAQSYYPAPGSTLPTVIYSGQTYYLQGGSSTTFYGNNITIQKNAKLFVQNNVTLKMNGKITVQNGSIQANPFTQTYTVTNGGEIYVRQGAKITNYNNAKWYGIEVWGSPKAIYPAYCPSNTLINLRGKAFINDATIEYAYCGIKLAKRSNNMWIYRGGIIKAQNSIFLNNDTMAMVYDDYITYLPNNNNIITLMPNNGENYFINCKFTLNNLFTQAVSNGLQPVMIRMNDVYAMNILACQFLNTKYKNVNFTDRNVMAILAYNSSYNINNKYQGYIPASGNFPWPWNAFTLGTITGKSSFTNFYTAITSNNINKIKLNISGTLFDNIAHGIVDNNHNYPIMMYDTFNLSQIGPNLVSTNSPVGDQTNAIEIFLNPYYIVENNNINGLNGNFYGMGIGVAGQVGYADNVIKNNIIKNTKIALEGNENPPDYYNYINNTGIGGLHFSCNDFSTNNNTITSTDVASFNVGFNPKVGTLYSGSYYSNYNLFGTKAANSAAYNIYNSLVDYNGNQLLNMDYYYINYGVNQTKPSQNYGVNLIDADLGINCDNWNQPILTSYPNAATQLGIWSDSIHYLRQQPKPDSTTIAQLSSLQSKYNTTLKAAISYALYGDSTGLHTDSLLLILAAAKLDYSSHILAANVYLLLGQYDSAVAQIDNISTQFTLSADDQVKMRNLSSMYKVLKEYYGAAQGMWDSLSITNKATLSQLMQEDDGIAGSMAKNLWYMNNDSIDAQQVYAYQWLAPEANEGKSQRPAESVAEDLVMVYPNPTTHELTIDLLQYNDKEAYTYTLYDITGAKVAYQVINTAKTVVDMQPLHTGIYMISISQKGKGQIYKQKVVKE